MHQFTPLGIFAQKAKQSRQPPSFRIVVV